jgi:2-octaprenyl-6-methoxyphenol hydroxylase
MRLRNGCVVDRDEDVDILIVGGGIIGAALLRALEPLGYRVLLVDDKAPFVNHSRNFDARSLALSPASITILDTLSVWPLIQANAMPIEAIHVSERGAFGRVLLTGDKQQPLGAVVEMDVLRAALETVLDPRQRIAPASLTAFDVARGEATVSTSTGVRRIAARLVIGADGADSSLRQWCHLAAQKKEYQQLAIVANIGLARPHLNWAYERFTSSGPLALLPMSGNRASLVWALEPEVARQLMAMSDEAFLKALQRVFGYRLGRFVKTGQRVIYPLRQVVMPQQVAGSVVFIGNAAHTLHPVAGQGFNLGLRDVATLVQCLAKTGLNEAVLGMYQRLRRDDHAQIIRFTDGLISLFTSRLPGVACARRLGLMAVDNSMGLKKIIARYASGYGGVVPDMVCGIPLSLPSRVLHDKALDGGQMIE